MHTLFCFTLLSFDSILILLVSCDKSQLCHVSYVFEWSNIWIRFSYGVLWNCVKVISAVGYTCFGEIVSSICPLLIISSSCFLRNIYARNRKSFGKNGCNAAHWRIIRVHFMFFLLFCYLHLWDTIHAIRMGYG